jgi:hypothetical protein
MIDRAANPGQKQWCPMKYLNTQMKLDQLISYLNEDKINLVPPFQRGRVWNLKLRKGLVKNMIEGRPIPAIFLYKEASGSMYSYNILDGKQRLESLVLFVGDKRSDLKIPNWNKYFFSPKYSKEANFTVPLTGGSVAFKDLDEDVVRDFREYAIPTIEISLDDESALDEIISLFVDINQYGVRVNRFDIVKAMSKNPLLSSVFAMVALKQKRQHDVFYRQKKNDFTFVLKTLQVVENIKEANAKVDRMWERLLEIALFARTKKHRAPVQILKGFIGGAGDRTRISGTENQFLRGVFSFLKKAYANADLKASRLAIDQTHFYTMVTSIISGDLINKYGPDDLKRRLIAFARALTGAPLPDETLSKAMKKYQEESKTQTTHISRRDARQQKFLQILDGL